MYTIVYTINHGVYMYMPDIQHVLLAVEEVHVQFMSIIKSPYSTVITQ